MTPEQDLEWWGRKKGGEKGHTSFKNAVSLLFFLQANE
jgi:hypothetical protein